MAKDAGPKGRKGGTRAKTARPESVGPHHVTRDQENPADPGIDPQRDYAAEIAELNRARSAQASGPVTPSPKAETADESGATEEMRDAATKPRDAPPLRGMAKE